MPKRIRKSPLDIEDAVKEILERNHSIRSVASSYGISRSALGRHVQLAKHKKRLNEEFVYKPNIGNRKVFSVEQEQVLSLYLKIISKMCFGLTSVQTRSLAYQFAALNNIQTPIEWENNKMAGPRWLNGFLQRNPHLTLRQSEGNSYAARVTSFNRTNTNTFFENLEKLLIKYRFTPDRIWNLDETGCSTIITPPKTEVSSAEKGSLVTFLGFINACGNTIPPVLIFPKNRFKESMLIGAPAGSLGLAHPSGWMSKDCFIKSLHHFVKHTKPTSESPILLLMDNNNTHVNIDVVMFARQHNIIALTLPLHCNHRMQPLDVTVYGPFKIQYRIAINDWLVSNPGKKVSIYEVAQIISIAYTSSFTRLNIISGFKKTGIHPFNKKIFTEKDFLTLSSVDESLIENIRSIESSNVETAEPQPGTSQELDPLEDWPKKLQKYTYYIRGKDLTRKWTSV